MTAPTLEELQRQFQQYLLSAPGDDGAPPAGAIDGAIADRFGLPAADRLAIYYNGYRRRLFEALEQAYDKTQSYLGDELFGQMCEAYIQGQPSTFRNLRWYGDQFSAFLTREMDEHPVVAELAAFEWALGLAFDAADASSLGADDVRHVAPEQWESIGFALHPSVQMLSLRYNAVAIWQALGKDQTPPEASTGEGISHWLVWRKSLQAHFRSMNQFETSALQGLQQGQTFAAVCEAAMAAAGEQDVTLQMAGWLQAWLGGGVLMSHTSIA